MFQIYSAVSMASFHLLFPFARRKPLSALQCSPRIQIGCGTSISALLLCRNCLLGAWARSMAAQAFEYRSTGSLLVALDTLRHQTIQRRRSPLPRSWLPVSRHEPRNWAADVARLRRISTSRGDDKSVAAAQHRCSTAMAPGKSVPAAQCKIAFPEKRRLGRGSSPYLVLRELETESSENFTEVVEFAAFFTRLTENVVPCSRRDADVGA